MNALLAALALAAAPLPEPLAPANQGRLQCHSPNPARKTCNSLASYKAGAHGTIQNTMVGLVSAEPLITMETVTPVELKGGQVCGSLRTRDLDAAKFKSGGKPLPEPAAAALRRQLKSAMKAIFGKAICTSYAPLGEGLMAHASVDGKPQPALDQRVLWVAPDDGYTVAP